jgi:alpha-L-rhamnosidase
MDDLACDILETPGYPGYRNMVESGATTLYETWHGGGSHNHPMFGSVSAMFFRYLAGIRPDWRQPGFAQFAIAPVVPTRLASARARLQTVRGETAVQWEKSAGCLTLEVTVPAHAGALVYAPVTGGLEWVAEGCAGPAAGEALRLSGERATLVFRPGEGADGPPGSVGSGRCG